MARWRRLLAALLVAAWAAPALGAEERFRVEDSIRFETLNPPSPASQAPWLWSPDRAHVALVSQTGDLARDEVVYRLWIYGAAGLRDAATGPHAAPLNLFEARTRRNREAISDATWSDDGRAIYFLGERDGARQVMRLDLAGGKTQVLTRSATDVVAFGAGGKRVVYSVEIPAPDLLADGGPRVVGSEPMAELLGLRHERWLAGGPYRTFVQDDGGDPVALEEVHYPQAADHMLPFVSPDGRWAITTRRVATFNEAWRRYANPNESFRFAVAADGSVPYWLRQFVLLDLEKRSARPVFDAPLAGVAHFRARERAVWLDGTRYVALVNTFLPLDAGSADETRRREARPAIVLFDPAGGRYSRLMEIPGNFRSQTDTLDIRDLRWRKRERILEVDLRDRVTRAESTRRFRVDDAGFAQVEPAAHGEDLELVLEQDYRTPPRLLARRGASAVGLGPANDHLEGKAADRIERLEWTDRTGRRWQGGMYLPLGYDHSHRYPLVIQTYGFSPASFRLDGAPLTGYAARALADEGMLVVQAPNDISVGIRKEGEVHRAMIEGLIDHLDANGSIDRGRVGLVGFSRTCYQVKYFLTHSKYAIRAASVADGIDFGYMQYVATSSPHRGDSSSASFELANGGHPFGEARATWVDRAPAFNADHVTAAVRVFANNRRAVLSEWEFYVALRRLGRPTEMVVLSDGDHVLHRPRQQWVAQQGNVDWFAFWLVDRIDPDPAKVGQYERWRALRSKIPTGN